MSNQIIPRSGAVVPDVSGARLPKRLARELAELQGVTALRLAAVRGETIIAGEKLNEVDFLAWKAMSGHAMLDGWANHLAGDNPALMSELRFFLDTSRLGKAEIIGDTIDSFRRM